jgi:hypothetical protein
MWYCEALYCKVSILQHRKERGHYCMCYMYVTVFVRNAANLSHMYTTQGLKNNFYFRGFLQVQALNRA